MSDEKLIELVRGYEELFDMSNRKYTDNYVKEKIWNSIGEELKKSGKTVNFITQNHSLIVSYSLSFYIRFYFLFISTFCNCYLHLSIMLKPMEENQQDCSRIP